jgi:DNA repair protein RadC
MSSAPVNISTESAEMRKAPGHGLETRMNAGFIPGWWAGSLCGQSTDRLRKHTVLHIAEPLPDAVAPPASVAPGFAQPPKRGRRAAQPTPVVADGVPPSLVPAPARKRGAKGGPAASPSAVASDCEEVPGLAVHERAVIDAALAVIGARMRGAGPTRIDNPALARKLVTLHLGHLEHECFGVLFLDAQHRLICYETMFRGTLTQTSVYPREVARRALHLNAAAVILAHNHPSGLLTPSRADELLTESLQRALGLLDVKVLDHIIVGGDKTLSMAEMGKV